MTRRAIVHLEIPAADRAEAAKFYSKLFGWDTQAMEEMKYTTFEAEGLGGGFPNVDGEFSKADRVLVYIDSKDINADLKQIEAAGGKMVHPKDEIPGFGFWAAFTDPTGNTIGLYETAPKS
jgi:predicted enzyme related to lactoylglutathione lyase